MITKPINPVLANNISNNSTLNTSSTSDSSISNIDTTNTLNAYILDVSTEGLMVITFSQSINIPMTYLTFNGSVLNIYIKPGDKYDTT